jgi:hypothetical protein
MSRLGKMVRRVPVRAVFWEQPEGNYSSDLPRVTRKNFVQATVANVLRARFAKVNL